MVIYLDYKRSLREILGKLELNQVTDLHIQALGDADKVVYRGVDVTVFNLRQIRHVHLYYIKSKAFLSMATFLPEVLDSFTKLLTIWQVLVIFDTYWHIFILVVLSIFSHSIYGKIVIILESPR